MCTCVCDCIHHLTKRFHPGEYSLRNKNYRYVTVGKNNPLWISHNPASLAGNAKNIKA